MRMAHIILVYKDPSQVERLIKKISHPDFDFYIHVDAKFGLAPFEYLGKLERVYLIKERLQVRWAGFSFTRAVFRCMAEALNSGRGYDFINCMSGQDYPLVSTESFHSFFAKRPGKNFLMVEEFGSEWWKRAAIRVHRYHMTDFDFKGRYMIQWFLNTVMPKRKFPLDYTFYGSERATWWTISADCAAYLVNFLEAHPK